MATLPKFESINSYAHKRTVTNIGNPAVVWHRGYWKPDGDAAIDKAWHKSIDKFIEYTKNALDQFSKANGAKFRTNTDLSISDAELISKHRDSDDDGKYPIFLYGSGASVDFRSHKLTVLFEKFEEFWSFKIIFDFSYVRISSHVKTPLLNLYIAVNKMDSFISDRLQSKYYEPEDLFFRSTELDQPNFANKKIQEISDAVSKELAKLYKIFFPICIDDFDKITQCDKNIDLFADFVGFSIGINLTKSKDATFSLPRDRPTPSSVIDNITPDGRFRQDDASVLKIIDAIWPVATEMNPYFVYNDEKFCNPETQNSPKREFSISRINRNRALYISSLGALRYVESIGIYYSLSYLIVCPHRSTWQIDKIIDRIHTMGIFRLASFCQYTELEKANDNIREIINSSNSGEDLDKTISRFKETESIVTDGLHYRIEWSKYYVRMFEEAMSSLYFEKVEGYQTYKEFVSRKLRERFNTIESVSDRRNYASRIISDGINKNVGKSIEDIMGFAETVSVFPIAYYMYYVFKHVNEYLLKHIGDQLHCLQWQTAWVLFSFIYAYWVLIYKKQGPIRKFFNKVFKRNDLK